MSKTIVVVGVTGIQGGSVARTFLQFPEWRVRGITRNPSGEAAQALAAEGVEIVQGDLDNKQSLVRAFEGATAIFSNTDFFGHLFGAIKAGNLPQGKKPYQYAYDREVAQGINIAEAAESPSVLKTLERFVLSSLSDATKWSKGKYTTVYHYDSKAEIIRLTRERCPGVFAKMSTLQIGHYVTNWKAFPLMAPQKQADGSFVWFRTNAPTFKMPFVVTHRDTGAFVKALVEMPSGTDALAHSKYLTWPEWAEAWGRVLGVKAAYKQLPSEEFFKDVPEALKEELVVGLDYIEEFGFTGGDPNTLEPEQLEPKVSVTPIEEYIKSEDWSSVLDG